MKLKSTLLSLSLALAACSGAPAPTDGGTGGGAGEDAGTQTAPLYAISTFVNTGGTQQSYLVFTESLTTEQHLDVANAIELAGASTLAVGPIGGKAIFVTGDATASLTRHDLNDDGTLTAGATVAFDGQGVTGQLGAYSAQYVFVNETKAYYFDARSMKAVIWNPTAMTVTGSIDLSGDLTLAGHSIQYSGSHAVRDGNYLFYGVGWLTADRLGVAPQSGMIVIDTTTDTATVVKDTRCGWARDGVKGADGKIYVGTEAFGAAAFKLDATKAGAPCMIRFDTSTRTWDSLLVEFDAVVNPGTAGDVAGMLVPGANGKAYVRVLDATLGAGTAPIALSTSQAWKLWEITLGDAPTATEVAGATATSGRSVLQDTGDFIIVPDYLGTDARTGLRLMTGDGTAKTTVEGQVRSVARVR